MQPGTAAMVLCSLPAPHTHIPAGPVLSAREETPSGLNPKTQISGCWERTGHPRRARGGPGTHITQCRALASSSRQRRRARAMRSVWYPAPTALCKAKGSAPGCAPRAGAPPGVREPPLTLAALQSATTSTLGTNFGKSSAAGKTEGGDGALGSQSRAPEPWTHGDVSPPLKETPQPLGISCTRAAAMLEA